MSEWVKIIVACIGVVICFKAVHDDGLRYGCHVGVQDGFLIALKAICEGHIKVEGRKFIFDEDHIAFINPKTGETASEIDMDDLTFEEVKL